MFKCHCKEKKIKFDVLNKMLDLTNKNVRNIGKHQDILKQKSHPYLYTQITTLYKVEWQSRVIIATQTSKHKYKLLYRSYENAQGC